MGKRPNIEGLVKKWRGKRLHGRGEEGGSRNWSQEGGTGVALGE